MIVDRERILENHRRLQEAMGDMPDRLGRSAGGETAERALAGQVAFYGSTWTDVGRSGIDWSGRHHDHVEWRAQLNRFFQLPALAKAFADTRDERYAAAARDYVEDWIRAHPTREGWDIAEYDNTLNLPIRVLMWSMSLRMLVNSAAFDDGFLAAMTTSAGVQLNWLMNNLKYRGNWYIAQADTLVTVGVLLDFLPDAADWRRRGVRILNEAFRRQVLPDGAHVERNPSYHGWMRQVFEKYWRVGRAMPELGLAIDAAKVAQMWDYSLAATRPDGANCALHDGGASLKPQPISVAIKARSKFLTDAALPDELPPTSQPFPDAQQVFLRDGWDGDATYLTFDATPMHSAHWHASRNAIQLCAHGRALIVDPGSFTYEGSDPFQAYGVSTRAHSTINLNGWDQTWSTQKMSYRAAPGYDLVWSLYDGGYWKGRHRGGWFSPGHLEGFHGAHYRAVLWIRGRAIVIIDHVYTTGTEGRNPSLESVWQLSPGPVRVDAGGGSACTAHDEGGNVLMLFPVRPTGGRLEVCEGQRDPLRGWVRGNIAKREHTPAPQVVMRVDDLEEWNNDLVTVLVPFAGKDAPRLTAEADGGRTSGPHASGVSRLVLRWSDGTLDELYWTRRLEQIVRAPGQFETDGVLVHLTKDAAGALRQGLVVDGTYCEPFTTGERKRLSTFRIA